MKSSLAVVLFVLVGCAHTPKQCHQEWFYELREDGSIETRGVIEGDGMWFEPYDVMRPTDPRYQEVLNRMIAVEPDFLTKKSYQITRFVKCAG